MSAEYILYQTVRDDDGEEVEASRWECANLHEAVQDLGKTRTAHVDGVEYSMANWTPWNSTLHLTVQNAAEFRTGCREERMLVIFPITHSSARRLAALLNCEWCA